MGDACSKIDNVAVLERIKYLVSLQRLGGIVKETKKKHLWKINVTVSIILRMRFFQSDLTMYFFGRFADRASQYIRLSI